jgi:oligopeptide transport system ATP-binding protein
VLELMHQLSAEYGVAMIMITHNLGVVARYVDRVNVMYAGKVVEQAETCELFEAPRHPYTLGLLKSVPRLDMARGERLESIRGNPPDLADLPPGCSYHPRCPLMADQCKTETPPLGEIDDAHLSACWFADRLGRDERSTPLAMGKR